MSPNTLEGTGEGEICTPEEQGVPLNVPTGKELLPSMLAPGTANGMQQSGPESNDYQSEQEGIARWFEIGAQGWPQSSQALLGQHIDTGIP